MPLITIKSLPPTDPSAISGMLSEIQEKGAAALRCTLSNIWVIFETVLPGHYLQETRSPIVIIQAQQGRSDEDREGLVRAVIQGVARGLSTPRENIWVHYQELKSKDVWFQERRADQS
jgi:phenylpyruvate tautomerase PptA (4-oxalocrotonate tautomerase family)